MTIALWSPEAGDLPVRPEGVRRLRARLRELERERNMWRATAESRQRRIGELGHQLAFLEGQAEILRVSIAGLYGSVEGAILLTADPSPPDEGESQAGDPGASQPPEPAKQVAEGEGLTRGGVADNAPPGGEGSHGTPSGA